MVAKIFHEMGLGISNEMIPGIDSGNKTQNFYKIGLVMFF